MANNKVVLGNETLIDLTEDTVNANNLLAGATAHDASGSAISGSMPNQGTKTASLNAGQSYTIPEGYHSGSGVVTANSLASQTVGTASANEILSGFTAWVNGVKLTGTATSGGATITVRYSSLFYNKTITCSNGSKTYTKTTTSSGSTEFSVSDRGTWTITCNGTSVTVDVTFAYTTLMKPDGKTITPVNDIQIWLNCGGIFNKTYTTINQVLADTTTLLALISDNNAVDYMVRSTNWANSVCANATAMTDIGANNYCANTLLSDSTWASAICNSAYFESVLNVKVPTMTGYTTPSGEVVYSSEFNQSKYLAWHAFDGSNSTYWISTSNANQYIGYHFPSDVCVKRVDITRATGNADDAITFKVSDDGSTWTSIGIGTLLNNTNLQTFILASNATAKAYMAVEFADYLGGDGLSKVQFYGRASS